MYVTHKPDQHDNWAEQRKRGKRGATTQADASTEASKGVKVKLEQTPSNDSASKLSLSKSLQAALVTTAGISEDEFNKIWADACSASGN